MKNFGKSINQSINSKSINLFSKWWENCMNGIKILVDYVHSKLQQFSGSNQADTFNLRKFCFQLGEGARRGEIKEQFWREHMNSSPIHLFSLTFWISKKNGPRNLHVCKRENKSIIRQSKYYKSCHALGILYHIIGGKRNNILDALYEMTKRWSFSINKIVQSGKTLFELISWIYNEFILLI